MKRSRTSALLLIFAGWTGQAFAGANAFGTAGLSWSRDTTVNSIQGPANSVTDLFLQIHDAPDIESMGLTINWLPFPDSVTIGYTVEFAETDSACGFNGGPPDDYFMNDSTYTTSIAFPNYIMTECIRLAVRLSQCDSVPPAKFYIATIITRDSNGILDTLQVTDDAKISGDIGCSTGPAAPPQNIHDLASSLTIRAYPSPASPVVTLSYSAQIGMAIDIHVVDVRGRIITSLAKNWISRGSESIVWRGTDKFGRRVAPGMYYARLSSKLGQITTPVVMVGK